MAVAIPPELWSEFESRLVALIEGNEAANASYTAGKGMSLASIAVGSVALRLSKVRAMTQSRSRDLQSTKAALEKATVKIREAAFTSSGDPENTILGKNLDILAELVDLLKLMEARAGTSAAVDLKRKEKGSDEEVIIDNVRGETSEGQATGGLFHDLGIIEPDDDPLSCLADEEDSAGSRRPIMRFLVEPVDPELAAKEKKLYWGHRKWADEAPHSPPTSTSLIGDARHHARALHEALLSMPSEANQATEGHLPLLPTCTTDGAETMTISPSLAHDGGKAGRKRREEVTEQGDATGGFAVGVPANPKQESTTANSGPESETTKVLRQQLQATTGDDYWPRLALAYSLEERGDSLADAARSFSARCEAYSEASELFRTCSIALPGEPESLLRQWVTARRARECEDAAAPPDINVLRRCIEICQTDKINSSGNGPESCNHPVCLEAHLELAGVLLERGQFESCAEACRHVLVEHNTDNAEALFSKAQALVALGRPDEARDCATRAESILAGAS